jgi:hypothetical protein
MQYCRVLLVNADFVRAIREKRLIEFTYKGGSPRVAEPHDYGVRLGVESLLAYQISGASRTGAAQGWKWFGVADMAQVTLLERRFPGSRVDDQHHHRDWDILFARVK